MSISEVKELTKYLTEEEVEKIKQEIKDKESTLKGGNLDEQEMIQVLNTLFAVLVIEKALESEMEEIEEIRSELEAELTECYEVYDTYMAKFRNQDKKKKKKHWLLSFFGLSEDITKKKNDIGASNKAINNLQKELNTLKQQKSDDHLRDIVSKRNPNSVRDFLDDLQERRNPRELCPQCVRERISERGGHRHHHHDHVQIPTPQSQQPNKPNTGPHKEQINNSESMNQDTNNKVKNTKLNSYSR